MKKLVLGFLALMAFAVTGLLWFEAGADAAKPERDLAQGRTIVINADDPYRHLQNNAFGVGEKLTFDLSYGFVHAGEAQMYIPDTKYVNGRKTYEMFINARSYPSFDIVYKVRDHYVTYLDVQGLFPWRFEQHVREGNYSRDFNAFFDPIAKTAETSDGKQYATPAYVHDIVSGFYFVRTLDLTHMHKGDKIELENFYNDKTYPLSVLVLGHQRITVDAGTFNCVVVEPLVVEGGLFKSEGSIRVWLTDDDNHMPVKMESKVIVGAIDATLTKYEGVKGPLSSKVDDN